METYRIAVLGAGKVGGTLGKNTLNRVSASVVYCSFVQPGAERRRA